MQKIVLMGCGFMGGMHAQIYKQLERAELVAVVDHHPDRVRAKLQKLGIDVPVFPTWGECRSECQFDVVDVCLPTDLHAQAALDAIAEGKHLFCEKPLALARDDARRLLAAARDAGVHVQVGHCIRFWPEYMAFKRFVDEGSAGRLLSLTLQRRASRPDYADGDWLQKETRSGGAGLDLHIHDTDFVLHLLGLPKAVSSQATQGRDGPSHVFTRYDYDDVIVHAEGGWNYPEAWGFQMAFQAVFERGAVEYDSGASPTLVATLRGGKREPIPFEKPGSGKSASGEGNISDLGGYFNELNYFIDCLENGADPQLATLEQAAESLNVTLCEIESAHSGQPVAVTPLNAEQPIS